MVPIVKLYNKINDFKLKNILSILILYSFFLNKDEYKIHTNCHRAILSTRIYNIHLQN